MTTTRHRVRQVLHRHRRWTVLRQDCRRGLAQLPDASIDAVITDPPYPEINRDYGRLGERQWHRLMHAVVTEIRRVLTPTGSAVFILQPNQVHVGCTRPWLWEFMAWATREWNMVQDVWWWNTASLPRAGCNRKVGLLRPSVKACVWLGPPTCYRNQDAILWSESEGNVRLRAVYRAQVDDSLKYPPSGGSMRNRRCAETALERGGVTPFNLLPLPNSNSASSGGAHGHGAATPRSLCTWWLRYLVPPHIGMEQHRPYARLSRRLLRRTTTPLFGG